MKWLTLDPDGSVTVRDTEVTLQDLQGAVGGYIEQIALTPDFCTFANEEGKLLGLPLNPYATAFMQKFVGDYIVGTMVFTGPPDGDGDITALDDDIIDLITSTIERTKN